MRRAMRNPQPTPSLRFLSVTANFLFQAAADWRAVVGEKLRQHIVLKLCDAYYSQGKGHLGWRFERADAASP